METLSLITHLKLIFAAPLVLSFSSIAAGSEVHAIASALSPDKANTDYKAIQRIIDHPEAVEPFSWARVAASYYRRGDLERATFWYYLFQIRSRPWRKTASDPSGYPALYGSISMVLGQPLNEWAASDPVAWKKLVVRAIAYEQRLPLSKIRPKKQSKVQWIQLNQDMRKEYEAEFLGALKSPLDIVRAREKNGLYVGPWKGGGEPLPDEWQ